MNKTHSIQCLLNLVEYNNSINNNPSANNLNEIKTAQFFLLKTIMFSMQFLIIYANYILYLFSIYD